MGSSTIALGIGALKSENKNQLDFCQHWITTNCLLDKHACMYGNRYPQKGEQEALYTGLPCLKKPLKCFHDENHLSILNRAFLKNMNWK